MIALLGFKTAGFVKQFGDPKASSVYIHPPAPHLFYGHASAVNAMLSRTV
jgi:hypothetical protein